MGKCQDLTERVGKGNGNNGKCSPPCPDTPPCGEGEPCSVLGGSAGWGRAGPVRGNQHLCIVEELKAPVGNLAQGMRGEDAGLKKASPHWPSCPEERWGAVCGGKEGRELNLQDHGH